MQSRLRVPEVITLSDYDRLPAVAEMFSRRNIFKRDRFTCQYEQSDLLERDMMRPKLLRAFGWQVTFVLAKDWYEDAGAVVDRLLRRLEGRDEPVEEDAEILDEEERE